MAKLPSTSSLLFLVLALALSGCAQAGPVSPEMFTSATGGLVSEGTPTAEPPVPSSIAPMVDNSQEALPLAQDATGTALAVSAAAERVAHTISAQSTATRTAQQAMEGLSVTASEGASTPGDATPAPDGAAGTPTPTPASLLARFFEPLASFESALPGLLTDLKVSPDGILWAVNENGIASLRGSTWTVHFPDVILWLAGFDDAGRTWLMNEPGTAALSWNGSEWRIYGDQEGWLPIQAPRLFFQGEEMVSDRTGRVWMTAYQDVRSFDGVEWTVHNLREIGFERIEETAQYDGFSFPAIEKDSQGNIWIGNCDSRGEVVAGQGARWFDGASWHGNAEPTASGCVQDIEVDPDGRVWMGIDDLLWRYDPSTMAWTSFELPEPPADTRIGWIQDIQFGPGGNPWLAVALCGGASCGSSYQRYRRDQEEWVSVPQPYEYDLGRLYFDPDGNTWLYSEKELFRVQGNTLEKIQGVEFCCITQDSRGWLYIAVKQGQQKLIFVEQGGR